MHKNRSTKKDQTMTAATLADPGSRRMQLSSGKLFGIIRSYD
jgi:hypothetical protein